MNSGSRPFEIAWKRFRKNRIAVVGILFLCAAYMVAIFAGFFSPYSPTADEFREQFFHPPTPLHFRDETGIIHIRPSVARTHLIDRNAHLFSSITPLYILYRRPAANLNPFLPDIIESSTAVLTLRDEQDKILGTANFLTETGNSSGEFLATIVAQAGSYNRYSRLRLESDHGEVWALDAKETGPFRIINENGGSGLMELPRTEYFPVRFFVRGAPYSIMGVFHCNLHLFGVDSPGRIFLLGTDQSGRDIFSRALSGAQISLSIGLIGVLFTTLLGLLVGGIAGFYGGRLDQTLMRFAEVVMSIPALYLILTLRNAIPERLQNSYDRVRELSMQTFAWQKSPATFAGVMAVVVLALSYYLYRNSARRPSLVIAGIVLLVLCFGNVMSLAAIRILQIVLPGEIRLTSESTYLLMILILSTVGWASMSRVIRGMVLSLREREYVVAARALGASDIRILTRHILPNTFGYVIVRATLLIPAYILGEVALSFLGVGVQEPSASWGNMLATAQNLRVLQQFTWTLAPGAFLFLTVLAFNFVGDGLRDALDPRL